jgi:hypothetical protein
MATIKAQAGKGPLLGAARALLRPLVRQLIGRGITYPACSRLLREVYIEVGTRYFTLPFKKQTDSRVALVTGIPRKAIGQFRRGDAAMPGTADDLEHPLAARVIERWLAAPYADGAGAARLLPYEGPPGTPSFVALVGEVGGDIPPRAVLDELLQARAATLTPRGSVQLAAPTQAPTRAEGERLAMLSTEFAELIAVALRDTEAPGGEEFWQCSARGDDLPAEALPAMRAEVRDLAAELMQAVRRVMRPAAVPGQPGAAGAPRRRAVVALYYYEREPDER